MKRIFACLTTIILFHAPSSASAVDVPVSAVREQKEEWTDAARKAKAPDFSVFLSGSPESRAKPVEQIGVDLGNLPEWPGPISGIRTAFDLSRDERFYSDNQHGFMRRASWLYPDDGCFSRAGHIAASLERVGMVRPGRVFAFGNLRLQTKYHPRGAVYWWYHVAAAYRSGNLVVVLDPSVQPDRPLLLEEWVARLSKNPANVRVALCDTHAYMASQTCIGGSPNQERGQVSHQLAYLRSEWKRLDRLNLNPSIMLRETSVWGREEFHLPFALSAPGPSASH